MKAAFGGGTFNRALSPVPAYKKGQGLPAEDGWGTVTREFLSAMTSSWRSRVPFSQRGRGGVRGIGVVRIALLGSDDGWLIRY